MSRPPLPPFDENTAPQKVRAAEDAWSTRDPATTVLAYTAGCIWRNRTVFPRGRAEIEAFLVRKWRRELDYRLIKELWGFRGNRMAVALRTSSMTTAASGLERTVTRNWQFDAAGLMEVRFSSINEHRIAEPERKFHWALGRRPGEHPGLTDLAL